MSSGSSGRRGTPLLALLREAREGSTAALNCLLVRTHPRILEFLWWRFPGNELRDYYEDVAAETLIRVARHVDQCNARSERSYWGWVRAIARGEGLRLLSSGFFRREESTSPTAVERLNEPAGGGSSTTPAVEASLLVLQLLLHELDEEKRRLLDMRFAQQLTWQEIAEALGTSESAAKRRFQRLQKTLAKNLEDRIQDWLE